MDPSYYEQWASRIKSFVLADDLNKIKYYLSSRTIDEKKRIIDKNVNGKSALFEACALQRYSIVRYFAEECGSDVNNTSDEGISLVHMACSLGDVALLEFLHSAGGNIFDYDTCLKNLVMIFIQNACICQVLLSRGVNVHSRDIDGRTALDYALSNSANRSLELLIKYGADVNSKNTDGTYPIQKACAQSNKDGLRILLHYGASVDVRDKEERTLLMQHILQFDICKLLIEYFIDVNISDCNGMTALHHAVVEHSDSKTLHLLITHFADMDAKDHKGLTPAAHAIDHRNEPSLSFLLEKGADVNAVDTEKSSLLQHAVIIESFNIIEILAKYDVNVNVCNKKGIQPIISAACLKQSRIVEYLIKNLDVENISKLHALEILASNALILVNLDEAKFYLKSAIQLRISSENVLKEETVLNNIFPNFKEPEIFDDLSNMNEDNETSMFILAALIRGRILGSFNFHVLTTLKKLINNPDSEEMLGSPVIFQIRKHMNAIAIKEFGEDDERSVAFVRDTVLHLCRVSKSDRPISITVDILSDCIHHATEALPYYTSENQGTIMFLLKQCMILIYLCLIDDTDNKNRSIIEAKFKEVILKCPDDLVSSQLIHFVLDGIWKDQIPLKCQIFIDVLIGLLSNNVSISAVENKHKRTPLHRYLQYFKTRSSERKNDEELVSRTIRLLLNNGNHICRVDKYHESILSLLQSSQYPVCEVRDRTLQCLAATVVTSENISYTELPPHLQTFVQQHENFEIPCSPMSPDFPPWFTPPFLSSSSEASSFSMSSSSSQMSWPSSPVYSP